MCQTHSHQTRLQGAVRAVAGAGDGSDDDQKYQARDAVSEGSARPGPEQRGGQHGGCSIGDSRVLVQAAVRRELHQLKETSETREVALAAELEHAVIVAQDYCGDGLIHEAPQLMSALWLQLTWRAAKNRSLTW